MFASLIVAAALIDQSGVAVKLPPHARSVLEQLLAEAHLASVRVSGTERSFERQVDLMLPQFRAAAAGRRELVYGDIGTGLYEHYLKLKRRHPRLSKTRVRALLIASLHARIAAIHGPRTELQHLAGGPDFAFDLAPSSIADPLALRHAIEKSDWVARCLFPGDGTEDAFHLEVRRDGKKRPSGASCTEF